MPGTFEQPQGPTPVIDSIANKVLGDIYNYLRTQSGADDTTDAVEELAAEQKKANQRQEVRSKAAESNDRAVQNALRGISNNQSTGLKNESIASRNRAIQNALLGKINSNEGKAVKSLAADSKNRAVQNALLGNVNKGIKDTNKGLDKLKDGFKQAMSGLKDFLTPFINKSLTHYTNFAKSLRMQNLTSAQKQQIGVAADQTFLDAKSLYGINVAKEDVAKFFEEMTAGGKDVLLMSDQQRAAYASLRARGIDDEKAYNAAMSGNHEVVQKLIRAAGDPKRRALITQTINGLDDYELAVGDYNKNLSDITNASVAAAENFNGVGEGLNVMKQSFYAATGQFEKVEGDAAATMGRISDDMSENIKNTRAFTENMTETQRRALGTQSDYLKNLANTSANIETMGKNGSPTKLAVRSDAENAKADRETTANGKLQDIIDSSVTKFNLATGGSLTALGTTLDKWLGDSADINSLVKNGFKLVVGALKTIVFNTSGLGKALLGLGGAAAIIALVANWDKIKPKLAPLLDAIKEVASDIISNLPSFITDAVSGIKNAISGIFKGGLFGGSGSSISGAASSIAGAVSGADIGQSVQDMGSSLSSMFGSIMDWIKQALPGVGAILHDIIGCINNAVTSIAPALSDICDVLRVAVDGLVELGVSIVDCIREIGVSLIDGIRDVLVAIAPSINSIAHAIEVLCEALAPVVPTIVEMIKFAVETILPPLVNKLVPRLLDLFEMVVQNILPPLLDIVKRAVNIILPPMMDILKTVANTLLPPLQEALNVVITIVDRIVNLILDILEPPLRAISEAVASIISVVTSVADFVKDMVDTAHGLFNFFVSKIPDLVGRISGLFNWLKDGFGPVISSGFDVIKDTLSTLWAGLKEIIAIAISPIIMAINAVDVILTSIKLFLAEAPVIGDKKKAAAYQEDLAKAMFKLNGADRGGVEEANYKAAAAAFEEALKSGEKDKIETAAAAYKKASAEYQSEAGSKITAAQIDRRIEAANLGKSLSNFTDAINSDILKNGPQMDEAAKEEVLQYLSGQKGNIAAESVFPPNTGSLLDSIKDSASKTLEVLTSIYKVISDAITLDVNLKKMSHGGIFSSETKAVVGEDGKELVLPLTKPERMRELLSSLSSTEKSAISGAMSGGTSSSISAISSDLQNKIIEGAAAQKGHSYAEMVCNQMVEAALNYAGFKPPIKGAVWRHFNHKNMHLVLNDPINGISPTDSALRPGMIMFSHPFTEEEAIGYNNGKTGPRKAGDPGHMGIYAGNGLWWNSTSAKNTTDYSSGKGVKVTDNNKGFGVALTKPFTKGTYKLFAAGYYDGMFKGGPSVSSSVASSAFAQSSSEAEPLVNGQSALDEALENAEATLAPLDTLKSLSKIAMASLTGEDYYRVSKMAKNAESASSNEDIRAALTEIVRYLRGIAASKKPSMAVSRPATTHTSSTP